MAEDVETLFKDLSSMSDEQEPRPIKLLSQAPEVEG